MISALKTLAIAVIAMAAASASAQDVYGASTTTVTPSSSQQLTGNPFDNTIYNTPVTAFPNCERICVRKEIHDLKEHELRTYAEGIVWLHSQMRSDGYSEFEALALLHNSVFSQVHGTPQFLVWHRLFLDYFEAQLQRYDPSICLPYWDQSREPDNLYASRVFDFYGRARDANMCITEGLFSQVKLNAGVTDSTRTCIFRNFTVPDGASEPAFNTYPWSTWQGYISNSMNPTTNGGQNPYAYINTQFELLSSKLHWDVAGLMLLNTSPADPLYWIHHTFIDKVYSDWQSYAYSMNATLDVQYGGYQIVNNTDGTTNTYIATLQDTLTVQSVTRTVFDVLDTKNLCYMYAQPGEGRTFPTQLSDTGSAHKPTHPAPSENPFVGNPLDTPTPSGNHSRAPPLIYMGHGVHGISINDILALYSRMVGDNSTWVDGEINPDILAKFKEFQVHLMHAWKDGVHEYYNGTSTTNTTTNATTTSSRRPTATPTLPNGPENSNPNGASGLVASGVSAGLVALMISFASLMVF